MVDWKTQRVMCLFIVMHNKYWKCLYLSCIFNRTFENDVEMTPVTRTVTQQQSHTHGAFYMPATPITQQPLGNVRKAGNIVPSAFTGPAPSTQSSAAANTASGASSFTPPKTVAGQYLSHSEGQVYHDHSNLWVTCISTCNASCVMCEFYLCYNFQIHAESWTCRHSSHAVIAEFWSKKTADHSSLWWWRRCRLPCEYIYYATCHSTVRNSTCYVQSSPSHDHNIFGVLC